MRRERSQSSDRGRPYVPRWDNPTGQLPGTGIPSGSDSGLHGTSRRRDSSVPERSRLRTSESGQFCCLIRFCILQVMACPRDFHYHFCVAD